jgi:hypothetical protein
MHKSQLTKEKTYYFDNLFLKKPRDFSTPQKKDQRKHQYFHLSSIHLNHPL